MASCRFLELAELNGAAVFGSGNDSPDFSLVDRQTALPGRFNLLGSKLAGLRYRVGRMNHQRPSAFAVRLAVALSLCFFSATFSHADTDLFNNAPDTEKSRQKFLSPQDAAAQLRLPPGFAVTLFAGEPDVRQPIAFSMDDRGRLWVAENYTYSDNGAFDTSLRDRLVILEDTDHDGRFDKRTVFWDKGHRLSSVVTGFGGVWVLCAPQLLFIPDRNGDDIPDGEPEVVLDGWAIENIQHNIVNGLMWGPDGWLYGRHGILATSSVGRPGTPRKDRVNINCGIWRFHPVRKVVEAVAHGTTNPWGMDFDEHGEGFFINTVIGHLWHLIPGAHYRRMFGQDMNPHSYELIDQHADHYHWDTGRQWQESRDGKGLNDTLGGGHAHSGLMIYLGNNWPDRYRNSIFTVNLHGYRLNNDFIQRRGSGYVGKHGPDFARTSDIWFRAVDLLYGPDGGVFIADWSDTGECHEADGVHRSSGRIYKIIFGEPQKPSISDVSKLSNDDLVAAVFHENEWFSRHARRVLQERAASGMDLNLTHKTLLHAFETRREIPQKLRAMWALGVSGGATKEWLGNQLNHPNEHVRTWAVRFLSEGNPPASRLAELARNEASSLVRLAIASALQRLPVDQRADVASGLLSHKKDADDHNLPLMIWYGLTPLGDTNPMQLVKLAEASEMPRVNRLIARRLSENIEKHPEALDALVQVAARKSDAFRTDIVQGITEGLRGWRSAPVPKHWSQLREAVKSSSSQPLKTMVRDLSLVFGDEAVITELKSVALNELAEVQSRRDAVQTLVANKPAGLEPFLREAVTNKVLAVAAARGLAVYDDPSAAERIIGFYPQLDAADRPDVIGVLVSRPGYANALLDAIAGGTIKRTDLSAFHARQIASLGDTNLQARLKTVWGDIRSAAKDKEQLIAKYKQLLTPERLKKAEPSRGREVYSIACALCHKLYGEGGEIGPDLTGSGRHSLEYLLENILDPAAIVAADFKMSVVTLKDGRVLNGVITAQTDRTITLQSFTESTTLERSEIDNIAASDTSLMPEGLLESLDETQTADLIAYLMSSGQVPLSK